MQLLKQDQEPEIEVITPPYQWATSTIAKVYNLDHLLSHNITTITGTVQCKKCKEKYEMEYNFEEKFHEVERFIGENFHNMHGRATESWSKPLLPTCNTCGPGNSMKPVITKKRKINWLFLVLGQMIGICHCMLLDV
ncbi:hypothetical protein Lal_00022950 [Lupinus albus]|nr:hypothetical protein Lal_00022950 [Lupinus albus]